MIQPKAIIAEDEEIQRAGMRMMLHRLWPELHICGEAGNGKAALRLIEQEKPDIAFLDIRMPEITGLDVARKVYENCRVVFVTAFDQYAIQAFEGEAVDYVLKPVSEARLAKTVQRLKKQLMLQDKSADFNIKINKVLQILEHRQPSEKLRQIKVKCGTELRFIPVSQVYFFKAEHKYTTVQTAHNEFIIKLPVNELEQNLDPDQFWRIHRSTIVNIDKIHRIKRSITNMMVITFAEIDKKLKVSRSHEHLFRHM